MSRVGFGVLISSWVIAGANPATMAQKEGAKPAADPFASQVARSQLRERAVEVLVKATVDREAVLRANAIEGLHEAPGRVEDAVRAGLSDENPGVRFVAAFTVGKLALKKSAAFVEPLLADSDPRVRAAAIFALTACGRTVDPTPLGDMLRDEHPLIRAEAARIVGEMGNRSAVPMLKSAAATADDENSKRYGGGMDEQRVQAERVFQMQVAEALVKLGEAESSDALRAALYPASREGFESAALAAQILGTLKDQRAVAQLVDLIEQVVPGSPAGGDPAGKQFLQPKEVRLAAAGALGQMGFPDGQYVGVMYLSDADATIRAQAVRVLGECQRAELARLASAMAEDPSPLVRVSAAAAVLRSLRGGK